MIGKAVVDPMSVSTYHETGPSTDKEEKIGRIKSPQSYIDLRNSIQTEGILDPIVIRCEINRSYVEVGERRVLAARDLGINQVDAIVYTFGEGSIPFELSAQFSTFEEVENAFPRKTIQSTISGVCTECGYDWGDQQVDIEVPALQMLRDYWEAGICSA